MKEIRKRVIKQVQKGDGNAFRKVVQHYHEFAYQVSFLIMGEEKKAEKLASDVFLYGYSHIDNFFNTNQRFSLWLVQIIVSLGEKRLTEEDNLKSANVNHFIPTRKHQDIQSLLMRICFKKRLALIFHSKKLFTNREIGEVLHIPKTELPSYIWQGREMLREGLFTA